MNKTYTLVWTVMAILIAIVAYTGCNEPHKYKIGVSQCSSDDWRMKLNSEIERESMLYDDAFVEIRSADDSNSKQIDDINYFVDNGFDIIIVSPNEAEALTPVIKEVYEKGIPVIIFDRNIVGDTYTARIGADDEAIGREAAEYVLSLVKESPRALEIFGRPGATPAENRHAGFTSSFIDGGGVVVGKGVANWNKEEAEIVTDSLLRIYPDINMIFAHNDRMAIGASEVVKRLGRNDIKILGVDAAPTIGIQAVADGVIDATFLYPTEGHLIVRTAMDILHGREVERNTILPSSSAVDSSNAEILLRQDAALQEETRKMGLLKDRIDEYWARHSAQTILFYASIVIIILLFGLVFMILRAFRQNKRHHAILEAQNRELEEQRDLQRDLNIKLEEATQSKLMFFTNVSHDLRTPITLIAEPVAQLASANNLTDEQRSLIKIADKNVHILTRLINQILDFRKYENGNIDLNLNEINLGKAIAEWADSFKTIARRRHIKLSVDTSVDDSIAVDAEKIERVVFNILSNAFKYTPDNGKINVSYRVTGDKAIITVEDTGRGIERSDLGNIFDRFYQVDKVHPNGSGIGLSLTKAFVELHGGEISVESVIGEGSTFTVSLPVKHVAEAAADTEVNITEADVEAELAAVEQDVADTRVELDAAKPVLLVIDDNADIRSMLTSLLASDYNIITAEDASQGIRRAIKYVPDLVICDVMMPGVDGLECCRRLKSEVTTSHIPVLMLTACSMDEQRVQGYESGADGYLSKPFNGSVLISRCRALIENRRRIKNLFDEKPHSALSTSPRKLPVTPGEIDNDFYHRFLDAFMPQIGNSDLSVDALASSLGLERTQFYRKIKSLTNFSPVELIKKIRLEHAMHLLKSSERTISEIAYDTGFSTPAYFTRCYREVFGETPSETRSKLNH